MKSILNYLNSHPFECALVVAAITEYVRLIIKMIKDLP